jgi:hypothetical protein
MGVGTGIGIETRVFLAVPEGPNLHYNSDSLDRLPFD